MQYASKLYMGKEIAGFSGVGRFWGIFNRSKLPRSVEMREEVAECVVVKFQRIARKLIQSQTKARFLRKLRSGKRVKWRRFRCKRPARIFTNDPAPFGRLLDWAEGRHYDDLALAGLPFLTKFSVADCRLGLFLRDFFSYTFLGDAKKVFVKNNLDNPIGLPA